MKSLVQLVGEVERIEQERMVRERLYEGMRIAHKDITRPMRPDEAPGTRRYRVMAPDYTRSHRRGPTLVDGLILDEE